MTDVELISTAYQPPYQTGDILYVRETWKKAPNGYYYYEDWQKNVIADITKWKSTKFKMTEDIYTQVCTSGIYYYSELPLSVNNIDSTLFFSVFGTVVIPLLMFFVFFFVRRDLVHSGTLAWCFLIGPFENFWLDVLAPMLPTAPEMSVGLKIACILIGSIIIILTLAYYIPIGLGYQTSDIFAFMAADLVKKSYGIGLIISYAILFVIGVALGSSWGIGTLIAVVAYGPIIDRLMGIIEPFSFAVAGMKKENKKGK